MQFHVEQPLWFLAAIAALPMAVMALAMFAAMSRLRRTLSAVVRIVLILLITAALAGIATVRKTDRVAVIAVVDVSGSVLRQPPVGADAVARSMSGSSTAPPLSTLDAVRTQLLRATARRGGDDLLGIVAFDGRPVLVASPSSYSELADRPLEYHVQEGTDIASALTFASSLVPADATGRLLLITDGVQTSGDALAAARALASLRIGGAASPTAASDQALAVDVVPLRYTLRPEVSVESLDAPPLAAIGAPITVRAVIHATDPAQGVVHLLDNDAEIDINGPAEGMSRRLDLNPGPNVFVAEIPVGVSRVHRFKVVFEPDVPPAGAPPTDRLADNNTAETFTITPAVGSVLLVDGVSEFGELRTPSPLAETLKQAGIAVSVVSSGGMPTDLLSFQNYDLVILENVPADAVSPQAQQALVAHVRDMGAGLVMVGGPMSYAAGGWKGSQIEPLLPVRLDLPDALVQPDAAIIFVMDNSGSMSRSVMGSSRSQQEIANESAARAVLSLGRNDLIGVISFNSDYEVNVPLAPNLQPTKTAQTIRDISPGGGTNAGPALDEARRLLSASKAKVKHVVLLSDGKSQSPELLPQVAAQMKREGISVSTISVGDAADVPTMKAIAQAGGGEHFNPTNPNILPRIFLKAIRVARTPLYREEPFTPVVLNPTQPALRGLGTLPALNGLNLAQVRLEPTIDTAITTAKGEPVLAVWRVELGQVAAFTSDAAEWAAPWIGWEGYSQFWAQMARTLSRPSQQRLFQTTLDARGDELHLRLDATDEGGKPLEFLDVPAVLYSPSGDEMKISLKQTGSGVYEGVARAASAGTYVAVIRPSAGDRKYSPVIAGASVRGGVESQRLEPDIDLMKSIASSTSGRVIELADLDRAALFDREGLLPRRTLLPLLDVLLPWTLAALLVDIAMRRIAWDRVLEDRTAESRAKNALSLAERLAAASHHPVQEERPTAAFTEKDARDLAKAQRDRRIAERLAAAQSASQASGASHSQTSTPEGNPGAAAEEHVSGLAAAKRRARQRFEE